jgi:hypothetical protein
VAIDPPLGVPSDGWRPYPIPGCAALRRGYPPAEATRGGSIVAEDESTEQAEDERTEQAEDEKSEQTEAQGSDQSDGEGEGEDYQQRWEEAHEKVKGMEDDPPKELDEWPDDEAKYVTFGGGEGDHGYDEGPEQKLGPSSVRRHEDGSVEVEGEKVDNPDDYKGERLADAPEGDE